jgi:hypothetical protein
MVLPKSLVYEGEKALIFVIWRALDCDDRVLLNSGRLGRELKMEVLEFWKVPDVPEGNGLVWTSSFLSFREN